MTSAAYESLRTAGYALAGESGDFLQRARVYRDMYHDSGKRNVFPLVAAHGALWASTFFKFGMLGSGLMSLLYLFTPRLRRAKLRSASEFADKFRDINRRVCAEAYAVHHYTKRYGGTSFIRSVIGDEFADILDACHVSNNVKSPFSKEQREQLFSACFKWEQEAVVVPMVAEAFDSLDWNLIKYLANRPRIVFAYFGISFHLQFKNFSSQDERISGGLLAYRRAEEVGLDRVESMLDLGDAPSRHAGISPAYAWACAGL